MKKDENLKAEQMAFNTEAVSILQLLIESNARLAIADIPSKSASVKFMLTLQDEQNLKNLGYSESQIDKIKPQEAADIIQAGTKAAPN